MKEIRIEHYIILSWTWIASLLPKIEKVRMSRRQVVYGVN